MATTSETIEEIEGRFKDLIERGPETNYHLFGIDFHDNANSLLTNYLGFGLVGERNVIYQYYRDIFEYRPFAEVSRKGFIKDIRRGKEELEKVTRDLEKYLSVKPENYSRMAAYKRDIGENVTVLTNHNLKQDLLVRPDIPHRDSQNYRDQICQHK